MRQDDDIDDENENHPALKKFDRTGYQARHILGKTLKWALIGGALAAFVAVGLPLIGTGLGMWGGGAIGGAAGAAIGLFGGPVGSAIGGVIGAAAGLFGGSSILAGLLPGTTALIAGGAAVAGAIGLAMGLSDAGETADNEAEKRIAVYERRETRQQRVAALEQQRDAQRLAVAQQAQAMGINPNVGFGRGPEERTL